MLQALACNFIKKEILAQVFSCEFCEIFKNTFLTERRVAASSKNISYWKATVKNSFNMNCENWHIFDNLTVSNFFEIGGLFSEV